MAMSPEERKKRKKITDKAYRERNLEKIRLREENYRKNNSEKVKQSHKTSEQKLECRYNKYKRDAKRRGKVFELTLKQFEEITSRKCYHCGEPQQGKYYCGIDRLDNLIGYTRENCVPCCYLCNLIKYKFDYETVIIPHIKKMVAVFENRQKDIEENLKTLDFLENEHMKPACKRGRKT